MSIDQLMRSKLSNWIFVSLVKYGQLLCDMRENIRLKNGTASTFTELSLQVTSMIIWNILWKLFWRCLYDYKLILAYVEYPTCSALRSWSWEGSSTVPIAMYFGMVVLTTCMYTMYHIVNMFISKLYMHNSTPMQCQATTRTTEGHNHNKSKPLGLQIPAETKLTLDVPGRYASKCVEGDVDVEVHLIGVICLPIKKGLHNKKERIINYRPSTKDIIISLPRMVHCGKWSCSLDLLLDLLWASNFVTLDGHVVKLYLYIYIYVNIFIECTGLCSQRLFHFLQFRCLDKEICSVFCAVSLPLKLGMLPSDSHPRFFMAAANYLLQVLTIKLWLLTSYICSMLLFPAQKNRRLNAFLFIFTCCFWLHKTTKLEKLQGFFLLSQIGTLG